MLSCWLVFLSVYLLACSTQCCPVDVFYSVLTCWLLLLMVGLLDFPTQCWPAGLLIINQCWPAGLFYPVSSCRFFLGLLMVGLFLRFFYSVLVCWLVLLSIELLVCSVVLLRVDQGRQWLPSKHKTWSNVGSMLGRSRRR